MVIVLVFIGLVIVWRVIRGISNHILYYLPPTAVGNLSKELNSQLAIASQLNTRWIEKLTQVEELINQTAQVSVLVEMMHSQFATVLSTQMRAWVGELEPTLLEDLIRQVSQELTTHIERTLLDRTTTLAGEYVLLQQVDELVMNVNLQARYHSPEGIRKALITILEWQPAKAKTVRSDRDLADWFIQKTQTQRELDLLLGRLGEELLRLQWEGAIALKKDADKSVKLSS